MFGMCVLIIFSFFSFIYILTLEDKNKQNKKEIQFLWERYLLLRLYMEYNEQQSQSYPKDFIQANSKLKIDFEKLPYYCSKIKDFYFSMKPFWLNFSPLALS